MSEINKKIYIGGMTCLGCQSRIENKLKKLGGVSKVRVSYADGSANLTYDEKQLTKKKLSGVLNQLGYRLLDDKEKTIDTQQLVGILIIAVAVFVIVNQFGGSSFSDNFPLAEEGIGLGMLFVIGLLTSVHCVAMCGGINISQCISATSRLDTTSLSETSTRNTTIPAFADLLPGILYNSGRVISYTLVGAIVGGLGSVITLDGSLKGLIQIIAGIFMVIMALNMLKVFPGLSVLIPHLPKGIADKIGNEQRKSKSPLIIGLLTGLMPCGPLQAMQLYALSTADPLKGALSMLVFSLGTVPLMFVLSMISSVLTEKFTKKVLTVGAVLVLVLGMIMFSQGWRLSALPTFASFMSGSSTSSMQDLNQIGEDVGVGDIEDVGIIDGEIQVVHSTLNPSFYPEISVHEGVPVKWIIDAPQGSINGCNNKMYIPEYKLEYGFNYGENVIEFTPDKTGTFEYSCWMGMRYGSITVS